MLHKYHSIIRVGAGLIQFVYGSHSRMAADLTLDKNLFWQPFSQVFPHQPGRLRGELNSQEIKKYIAMSLKPGKSTGPDRCPNELTKTMTDEEFQIEKCG